MMNTTRSRVPSPLALRLVLPTALVLLMSSSFLRAVDGSWNVATGGDWSTTTNWSPTVAPGGNGTTVNFTNNITGNATVNLDGGITRTAGIINIGDANGTHRFTLSTATSAPLVFNNTANLANAQLNFVSSGTDNTISAPIQLASSLDVRNNSSATQTLGTISASTAGLKTITNSGTGTGSVSDASIIGDGSGQIAIRQNSATSSLSLGGVNTYTGGTTLDAGKLSVTGASALGTGTVVLNGGTLANGGGAVATMAAPVTLAGNVDFVGTTAGTSATTRLVLSGAMTLTGNREVAVSEALNLSGGGYVQLQGGIAESGGSYSLTKVGIGTLELLTGSGRSLTYSGGTFVNGGILKLTTTGNFNTLPSTGAVTISGGTLDVAMGTRAVENVGAVSLVSGSIIGTSGTSVLNATSYSMSSGTVSKNLGGTGSALAKITSGTVSLSGSNSYTGATTVAAGTLLVAGTGAVNSTSGITVNGGQVKYDSTVGLSRNVTLNGGLLAYNSAANYSGALNFTSGSIGGTNLAGNLNNLTIGSGQSISPGNSPGTAATGDQTWAGGGSYVWEINNATGTAGSDPGWDLITGTGALTITATSGSKFNINITSLTLANVAGDAVNFSSLTSYKWKIADFSSAITFDASVFNINVAGFSNSVAPGSAFGIALGSDAGIGGDNTELYLTYAVPEPSTLALLAFSVTTVMVFRRRSRV